MYVAVISTHFNTNVTTKPITRNSCCWHRYLQGSKYCCVCCRHAYTARADLRSRTLSVVVRKAEVMASRDGKLVAVSTLCCFSWFDEPPSWEEESRVLGLCDATIQASCTQVSTKVPPPAPLSLFLRLCLSVSLSDTHTNIRSTGMESATPECLPGAIYNSVLPGMNSAGPWGPL